MVFFALRLSGPVVLSAHDASLLPFFCLQKPHGKPIFTPPVAAGNATGSWPASSQLPAKEPRYLMMELPQRAERVRQTPAELEEESRKLRRLQIMMNMVMSVLSQDPDLSIEEASGIVANAKRAVLAMFPDKELAFDLIYRPRLQRLIHERFRLQ
jgi:hypothetical protein